MAEISNNTSNRFLILGLNGHKVKISLKTTAVAAFAAIAALALIFALRHGTIHSLAGRVSIGVDGLAALLTVASARSLFNEYIRPFFIKDTGRRDQYLIGEFGYYGSQIPSHPACKTSPSPIGSQPEHAVTATRPMCVSKSPVSNDAPSSEATPPGLSADSPELGQTTPSSTPNNSASGEPLNTVAATGLSYYLYAYLSQLKTHNNGQMELAKLLLNSDSTTVSDTPKSAWELATTVFRAQQVNAGTRTLPPEAQQTTLTRYCNVFKDQLNEIQDKYNSFIENPDSLLEDCHNFNDVEIIAAVLACETRYEQNSALPNAAAASGSTHVSGSPVRNDGSPSEITSPDLSVDSPELEQATPSSTPNSNSASGEPLSRSPVPSDASAASSSGETSPLLHPFRTTIPGYRLDTLGAAGSVTGKDYVSIVHQRFAKLQETRRLSEINSPYTYRAQELGNLPGAEDLLLILIAIHHGRSEQRICVNNEFPSGQTLNNKVNDYSKTFKTDYRKKISSLIETYKNPNSLLPENPTDCDKIAYVMARLMPQS